MTILFGFCEFSGKTIHATIVDARLDELKRHLHETEISIASLTITCGFKSENYAKNLFETRFGMSMTPWRAQHALKRTPTLR